MRIIPFQVLITKCYMSSIEVGFTYKNTIKLHTCICVQNKHTIFTYKIMWCIVGIVFI